MPGRGWGRAWILVKDKAPSHPEHPDAPLASPQVGFAHGRGGHGGAMPQAGTGLGGRSRTVPSTCRPTGEPGSSA